MPKYLNFIKGLIDSDDFDLNISREILQKSKTLQQIKKKLVRKIIGLFKDLADDDKEKYLKFYNNFNNNLKLGVLDDPSNRDRLAQLLRYYTYKHQNEMISLDQYVDEFKKGQDVIYFLSGENKEAVLSSPLIEKLVRKGKDVVVMTEPIDEYVMQTMFQYQGKYKFVNLGKEADIDKDDKKNEEKFKPLSDYLKEVLSEKVSKVAVSSLLTKSPAVIVSSTYGHSATMERIMKNQPLTDSRLKAVAKEKKILQINPRHPIMLKLLDIVNEGKQDTTTEDMAKVIYDTAMINSGFSLEDPSGLITRVNKMLSRSLQVDENFVIPEEPIVEEVEEPPKEEINVEEHDDL